jgi:hypothetical protein
MDRFYERCRGQAYCAASGNKRIIDYADHAARWPVGAAVEHRQI